MQNIDFTYNWNKKLDCDCFTTFRIYNPAKYKIGDTVTVSLKGQIIKECVIIDVKKMKIAQVNTFIANLDTGYSVDEFKKIVHTMYKKTPNIESIDFALILLKTTRTQETFFP
ncbi:MAG: hypothetical protein OHK0045_22710 [Raineya sp.]